ncbi:poly-gamma-glutamate biosynthesis protein PgsC/CapC [Qipengyuania psychrotolerans]|uniref:Poly-gamma-glutamate biosynthesis protein PgsC/CapC n=1 Tax=Qipengyuania psychrotolerans TaxID=2867238 RepID=A0ABX8ZDI4_9SPHN|nr:poly-gamma-glutamate biosynthesis protein PgsC/CapC [Qipengyuania psychrotolerans]QZD87051.1 poly-gamma-glutamate biosynthesis protein PgsC/CapC [Qipengyuania psychrotolerans]
MILSIFPEGGLASSVITTVWVGVLVLCFFNLRFGWVLSGLVVPGYVVPLLVVKPMAALVITVEAILAYWIVWIFSEKLAPGRWPALFGRDRFMGLILASVAVRLSMDGLILPELSEWLATNYNQRLDWQSDLQSFGLVIISLLANQFWKPGLARGLFSMIVVTAITYLIVRYGLMEFTNFRLSAVTYMYEGLASSILASPKAYMILVLTALYASHMNVKYGWDFSGILIPALIALQWYQPTKILTSFAEAAVIYFIARQLLKTPWLQNATIEGANKMLLFFNISFVLKLIVGHSLVLLAWDVKTTDFYGFGYLLSTLLAIKAHDKDIFPRLLRSTLQVSAIGAILGNLAGIAVAFILPASAAQAGGEREATIEREQDLLVGAIGDARLRRATLADGSLDSASAQGLADALELLGAGLPPVAAGLAGRANGWQAEALPAGRLALLRMDGRGSDLLVHDQTAPSELAVVIEDPGAQPGLGLAAAKLARQLGAKWLVITTPQLAGAGTRPSVLQTFRSKWRGPVLSIQAGSTPGARVELADGSGTQLDIASLREVLPDVEIGLAAMRRTNAADVEAPAILTLPAQSIRRMLRIGLEEFQQPDRPCRALDHAKGSANFTQPAQRVFLRDEVLAPLLEERQDDGDLVISRAASRALGLDLYRCSEANSPLLALVGTQDQGRAIFDLSGRPDRIVMASLREEVGGSDGSTAPSARIMRDAAFAFARSSDASLLVFAPRELGYDGSQATMFGTIAQTAIDQLGDRPALALQIRSYPAADLAALAAGRVVVSTDRVASQSAESREIIGIVQDGGFDPVLAERSREWAGFEAFSQTALLYLNHSLNKRYAVLYVPTTAGKR